MEDPTKVVMTGGEGVVTLEMAARRCSLLACTYRSEGDASKARRNDVAEEESSRQRNMAEALALASSEPIPPTMTFADLKVCIATFTGLLWALFGDGATTIKSANYLSDYG